MKSSRQFDECEGRAAAQVDLKPFDGLRVIVLMPADGRQIPFHGTGRFENHPTLGHVLRVVAEDELACPEVILSESLWRGSIKRVAGGEADFCFSPRPAAPLRR